MLRSETVRARRIDVADEISFLKSVFRPLASLGEQPIGNYEANDGFSAE